jgi:hypothetical protein
MSEHEIESGQFEQRSKFKVTRNAKGDPQWEISVVSGATQAEMDELRGIAVAQYRALEQDLVGALRASVA